MTIDTAPQPAASIVLLRDGDAGLEVFLMQRHGLSEVLGGAYVFPGGKLDAGDADLDMELHLDQPASTLHRALNEPDTDPRGAAALYIAGLREAFEESGVLLALGPDGAGALDIGQARRLSREGQAFDQVLAQMQLRLQTRDMVPWSRWITPRVPSISSKRFDTRFFVAAAPVEQVARHDDRETTDSLWLGPRAALEQYWASRIELAPPQIMSLAHLSRHRSVADVLQAARRRVPPVIAPEPFDQDGTRVICYPGDQRHSNPVVALPGPTRLVYRNKRFEPPGGFEALFA